MKFDVNIFPQRLNDAAAIGRAVEDYGFNAVWASETTHNPFLPLTHMAAATERVQLGTAIAVAFPRSPMVAAQIAWDLAEQSNGRFILGLGTQVEAHITKRFSSVWSAPAPRMKEYVESLRAIWQTFQTNTPLNYTGELYTFKLMTPFFNPGKIAHPDIPVYVAGVNAAMCRVVGEVAQGLHVHPFHTVRYLQEVALPNVAEGAARAGKSLADIERYCAVFVVTGATAEERANQAIQIKSQIAFYASTPSYSAVMELHGWLDLHERLRGMARLGQWSEMWELISDEMLAEFAVIAAPDELASAVQERYAGLLTRVGYYFPFEPDDTEKAALWRDAARVFGV
ncbi:MAG: TIGR03617 family F420-dependent LLM class oxidoreductase [Phototrophicaceae bacterium]|jgi:probable F420-dependent oxidoreductase